MYLKKHNHLQTSQCREAQECRRNYSHMQRITGDVSWGSAERTRAHPLTRRTKHHDWFSPITRGQVLHHGLFLSHPPLSLPVCLRQGDRATHKKNPLISRRAGGGRIRTVGVSPEEKQRWTLTVPPPLQRPAPKITIFLLKALLPKSEETALQEEDPSPVIKHAAHSRSQIPLWYGSQTHASPPAAPRAAAWCQSGSGVTDWLAGLDMWQHWNCLTGYRETDRVQTQIWNNTVDNTKFQ